MVSKPSRVAVRALRASVFLLLALVVTVHHAGALEAPPAPPSSEGDLPLWVLTHEGDTLYLLGSVHMLRPEAYPLDEALTEAFRSAQVVAFELDFAEFEAGLQTMMQRGSYQDGRTLRNKLSDGTFRELEDRMEGLGVPMALLENMKPWMASMMLSALIIQEAGYEAEAGVDLHFYEQAVEDGREVVALETIEEQISVFDDLSTEAQVAFLESTLEELDQAVEQMDEMSRMWETGDGQALAEALTESLLAHPEVAEALLYERNRNWVPQIEALLERPERAIVIVGAGHLVGEGSVVELLRARGYFVEQWGSE